jgi:hypothetical protein
MQKPISPLRFQTHSWRLPRRTFLRGLGASIALPALEAMAPSLKALEALGPNPHVPRRMAFCYIPNGANMADWTPAQAGADFEWPFILEPLEPFKNELQILTGLAHDKARAHGDGGGDHARASASFLTGCQARKTAGADIKAGVSVDQIAAEKIGRLTRLPSLELSGDRARSSGDCDSGYSCAYQFNLSWKTEATPMPPEVDPRVVFERLFGSEVPGESDAARIARLERRKSILDFVAADARRLSRRLGHTDRRKLDEYLTAVREVEARIQHAENFPPVSTDYPRPEGIPPQRDQHMRLMFDLLTLAFQTDTTRIATYIIAHDGDNRPYPMVDVPEGHHELSHHGNDETKKKKIARINRFHTTQFAYFLEKLKSVREGEGTLLDNCMIVYGGAIADGNAHNHDNLPVLLAGRGGGSLRSGGHLKLERETPMTNLYLSMLDRLGVPAERVGDSTGRLENI